MSACDEEEIDDEYESIPVIILEAFVWVLCVVKWDDYNSFPI